MHSFIIMPVVDNDQEQIQLPVVYWATPGCA